MSIMQTLLPKKSRGLSPSKDSSSYYDLQIKKHSFYKDIWKRFKKNRLALISLVIIGLMILFAILADYITPYGYDEQNLLMQFTKPNREHIFGTDNFGRDIFSRIIYGSRISLSVGFIAVSFSSLIGIIIGSIAGYFGGWIDNIIMRLTDIFQAIPSMLLAIAIAATLGPGLFNLMIAVGIGSIPGYARIIRASILSIKEQEYVEAARSIGSSNFRIILKEILPNAWAPIIVQATMSIAYAILATAGLSFIGLGINPPTPEWGSMLSAGRSYMRDYSYVVLFPGMMIMITVFAFNLLGDGLRDALDPRLRN